jgi:hypothetical protein
MSFGKRKGEREKVKERKTNKKRKKNAYVKIAKPLRMLL